MYKPRKDYLNFWGISSMGRGIERSVYKTNVSLLKTTRKLSKPTKFQDVWKK